MSDELVQRKRRDKGEGGIRKPKDSPNWSISYYGRDGRQTTESSRSPVKAVAIALLQERIAQVKAGVQEPSRADRITLKELLDDVVLDYRSKNQATTDEAAGR